MSIGCDFCPKLAERHDDLVFIAAPSGLVHICEGCVAECSNVLSRKKLTDHKQRATTDE